MKMAFLLASVVRLVLAPVFGAMVRMGADEGFVNDLIWRLKAFGAPKALCLGRLRSLRSRHETSNMAVFLFFARPLRTCSVSRFSSWLRCSCSGRTFHVWKSCRTGLDMFNMEVA